MILSLPTKTRRINLTPVDYSKALYKMGIPLTTDEQKLHDALLKVDANSFWGNAIMVSFIDYTDVKFRQLYADLLSQLHDSPDTMYRILGKEAYDLLIKLRP